MTAVEPRLNAGDFLPGDVEEGPRASSSQAGLAAIKYGPKTPPRPRPFQAGDRVRITDHNRRIVAPDTQYVFEGIVSRIDPPAAPESGHDFGPYLWIDTEPFRLSDGGPVTATFCPLTDDMTAGLDGPGGRSIELLEPAPTDPSGGAVTAPTPAPSGDTAPDHGPLAAPLSDRTLAKVLSRPAHGMARVFGFNVVTISPQGIPGGPRLDGVVSRQRALDELDELEPFMTDGWTTVLVELREVAR